MSPDPDPLSREIQDALEGVDLQSIGPDREEPPSGGGGDRLYPGTVTGIHGDDVIVDLGPRMQGVCSLGEFEEPPSVGDVHRFVLRGREDDLWLLSLRAAREVATWDALEPGATTKARVKGQNKGGLVLELGKHEGFMPASQVSTEFDFDASSLMGQTVLAEVLEIDRGRGRVVLSRRKVEESEKQAALEEAVGRLAPGLVLTGKVKRIEPFGAFVDVGGVEGLLHVSNVSRKRVEKLDEVLSVGQEVQVKVLDVQEDGRRIALGMKQLEPDPWDDVEDRLQVDGQVVGKVTRVADFGAFVELFEGVEGLVHVSQLSRERVRNVGAVVRVGDEVTVRVTSIDPAARRISLSRLDARGAVIGSEDAAEADAIDDVLRSSTGSIGTNLGSLFKKALEDRDDDE